MNIDEAGDQRRAREITVIRVGIRRRQLDPRPDAPLARDDRVAPSRRASIVMTVRTEHRRSDSCTRRRAVRRLMRLSLGLSR